MMNMGKMLKQAQTMQKNLEKLKAELAETEFETTCGGGAVKVVVTGDQVVRSIKIDPSVIKEGDTEMIEDLVLTGVNQALDTSRAESEARMQKITSGLSMPKIPGMDLSGFGF